tara:strand:+ start:2779 stop:3042 length:264 start_codon:yes stop_codon:yes gene_type:complete
LLIIEVTNAREVMRERLGPLGDRLLGKVLDAEAQVEKALIQEMELSFQEFGIQARILSVEGPKLRDENHLDFPIKVREARDVHLKDE